MPDVHGNPMRGEVYWVSWSQDVDEKPWVVVSNNARNASRMGTYIVARVSTRGAKNLAYLDTVVPLTPADRPVEGAVICDTMICWPASRPASTA